MLRVQSEAERNQSGQPTLESATMGRIAPASRSRTRLLAEIPADERRRELAGIWTSTLEGGEGSPIVLLHGPGEFAGKWLRVIPQLVRSNRVVAPDLPGHGATGGSAEELDVDRVLAWVGELIAQTCSTPPTLVGHVMGGAIAARFAIRHADRISRLVLVDSLGLAPFRPSAAFAVTMALFRARPNQSTYRRFMRQCSYDLERLENDLGNRWEPFVSYTLELAHSPAAAAVSRMLRLFGLSPIPADDLAGISVPTTLIWGRHDRANRLKVAQAASTRYGWPLHVIEDCADDPPRDHPEAFLAALRGTNPSAAGPATIIRDEKEVVT